MRVDGDELIHFFPPFVIECRFFGGVWQRAVVEPVPASGLGGDDRVAGKGAGEALWRSVVKENEHRPGRDVVPARGR